MEFTHKISGAREIERALQQLDERVAKKGARAAVRAGNKIMKNEVAQAARTKFNRQTGTLLRNIRTMIRLSRRGWVKAYVFLGHDAFYGRFFERGFRHIGRGKGRRSQLRTGRISGKPMRRPWMEPAFEAAAPRIMETIVETLRSFLSGRATGSDTGTGGS